MRSESQFLINGNLDSVDTKALLRLSLADRAEFWSADTATFVGAVPLVSVGALQAGVGYPSSADATQSFYLPKYELRRQDGVHTTRLARHTASNDRAAPVGSLTIEVEPVSPAASVAAAQIMPHEIRALRLGYRIPLVAEASERPAPTGAAALAGRWHNLDPDADGVVKLAIETLDSGRLSMRCKTSEPANDGAVSQTQGFFRDGEAMAMFHLPDRFITLHLRMEGPDLRAVQLIDVLDGNTPGDGMTRHSFARETGADEVPLIWFALEPPVAIGPTVWRSVTQIVDDETYLRLFKVMTEGEHAARLEATCSATVGQRTWRQNFVGHMAREKVLSTQGKRAFFMGKQQAQELRLTAGQTMSARPHLHLDPAATFSVANPAVRGQAEDTADRASMVAAGPGRLSGAVAATPFRPDVAVRPGGRPEVVRPVVADRPVMHAVLLVLRPEHVAPETQVPVSDVVKDEQAGARPPRIIVCDPGGVPVLTRRREDSVQFLAPLWFDRAEHDQVFDAPLEESGRLVLLRHEIRAGDRTATFYQDGLEPRQIYYEPEEFRLARSDYAPFAPAILFHMGEEVDADAQDADGITFSVTLTYRALPFLHPALLQVARERFGREANIAAVAPAVTTLRIRLQGDANAAIERKGAQIDLADGISDVLTFSEAEYHRLTTALQTVSGVGLEGEIEATLLDGRTARIPIRIGLREAVGSVFDWAVTGAADGGCVVSLRNRIESPVRIDELPVVQLGAAASAAPAVIPPAQPIPPGETASVGYRVTPSGASVAGFDFAPVTSIVPNLMAILAQTTVVQGYAKDTFEIDVFVDPMFFSTASARPLTGVQVTFRTREEPVVLTPAQPKVRVTLQMPLLLFVTNANEAQHYSYSVTNLHADGPGATTAFTAGLGNLEVTPATL